MDTKTDTNRVLNSWWPRSEQLVLDSRGSGTLKTETAFGGSIPAIGSILLGV